MVYLAQFLVGGRGKGREYYVWRNRGCDFTGALGDLRSWPFSPAPGSGRWLIPGRDQGRQCPRKPPLLPRMPRHRNRPGHNKPRPRQIRRRLRKILLRPREQLRVIPSLRISPPRKCPRHRPSYPNQLSRTPKQRRHLRPWASRQI